MLSNLPIYDIIQKGCPFPDSLFGYVVAGVLILLDELVCFYQRVVRVINHDHVHTVGEVTHVNCSCIILTDNDLAIRAKDGDVDFHRCVYPDF